MKAQVTMGFNRVDTIPVIYQSQQLPMAWAGGLNFCQLSEIDLNLDGIQDLFVFDRTGNKITTYINNGTPNQVDYVLAPEYVSQFPRMHDWVLLRDYNCDGKADIFTYSVAGFSIYKNVSTVQNGLQFQLVQFLVNTNRSPNSSNFIGNLYVSQVDIPVIRDLDGDGDLDVLTFGIAGTQVEYHKNMSIETYGICDSIKYVWNSQCWGQFTENALNANITLNTGCPAVPIARDPDSFEYSPLHTMHAGSCMECFYTDADNDPDILIGDITNPAITYLRNGGTTLNPVMDTFDYQFPHYDVPVAMNIFPCPFHLDINNDGKKDLIFSPSAVNTSENKNSLWYYNNTGTNSDFAADFVQNNFLQDQMIDLGEGAYPVFFDYDNDGDKDLLVGNYGYYSSAGVYPSKIALFKNNGTLSNPIYSLQDDDFANIYSNAYGIICLAPTFGDLDGDGDKDMIVGDVNGKLHYFRKDAGPADNFVLAAANYQSIDVGSFAAPQLFDVNGDGLLDLLIGEQSGNVNYYQNTGTANAPLFTSTNPLLGNVIVNQTGYTTGYSTPCMFMENNQRVLLVGSERGFLFRYDNIDNNLSGSFTLTDSLYVSSWEGGRIAATIADINNDFAYDVVIGNYSGGMSLFMGDNSMSTGNNTLNNDHTFTLYPNPATESFVVKMNVYPDDQTYIELFDISGKSVYRQKTNGIYTVVSTGLLQSGLYICTVSDSKGNKTFQKLLIN
ncbi:MAG: hypothetical protein Fur0041_04490 [Bacteroidia bacterium]